MNAPAHKRAGYALARLFLRTIGRSSDGVRLCYDEGLTSGRMLEYVYRNRPSGRLPFGPAIDRAFLSAPGWVAIRERRERLEDLLARALRELRAERGTVRLVDVASGPAAYVLAVLDREGTECVTATCRDLEARSLAEGRAEAERRNLRAVRFEHGDALDGPSIAALQPDLVVASGFYDWIVDDATVRRSIEVIAAALQAGGRFVLTHQCAHPNYDFVANVFPHFDGAPLRMKMRDVATVHRWLTEAGFEIETLLTDSHEYYAITLARRRAKER
jgi:SAM-dependent methyltransferase